MVSERRRDSPIRPESPNASGNVYVTDTLDNTVRKITPAGVVTTLAGSAGQLGSVDGTGDAARFRRPTGIVADSSGNLYVADTFNQAIRKITPSGVVTTVAGSFLTVGDSDGTGTAARFRFPTGIAIDQSGDLFVADEENFTPDEEGLYTFRLRATGNGLTSITTVDLDARKSSRRRAVRH